MNALSGGLSLKNLSNARDTETMQRLLNTRTNKWDVLDAGTTMRFCTAFLAVRGEDHIITGSARMKERPIALLVDALRELGSTIEYLEIEGFPPLRISKVVQQRTNKISIPGNISSQYISALLMIAPVLPQGLELKLTGEIYSIPYINMTLSLMTHFGIEHIWDGNVIAIDPQEYLINEYEVEGDWSGASYWYSICALNQNSEFKLKDLRKDSHQGDQRIANVMEGMGVTTKYESDGVRIKNDSSSLQSLSIDFRDCPDLAQTVMVAAAIKGIYLEMTGLESLKIKETDRITAMQGELSKLDCQLIESGKEWKLVPGTLPENISEIATYDDHRMAMAFAPISMARRITIENPDVVRKSYPDFWKDLESIGIQMEFNAIN